MRLLHAKTLKFHEFHGWNIPDYAILSHRWEGGEVTYQDMLSPLRRLKRKAGLIKVRQCCLQAVKDGHEYVWIDTCCIDKTSSAELSEAINSMYQWYQKSAVCYAYLSDVQPEIDHPINHALVIPMSENTSIKSQIFESLWWTRGWTLQELIAPRDVKFFGSGRHGWLDIGDKSTLLDLIILRSRIHRDVLCGLDVQQCSIAMRMSWASERETTRSEDLAYCLLGIFGVNMPLLYGEGDRAFIRLQEEIIKQSDDQTLFAWVLNSSNLKGEPCGPLAISPSMFHGCSDLLPVLETDAPSPYSMTNKGLRFELPIVQQNGQRRGIAILPCSTTSTFPRRVTLPIVQITQDGNSHFARDGRYTYPLKPVTQEEIENAISKVIFMKQNPEQSVPWQSTFLIRQRIAEQNGVKRYQQLYSSALLLPDGTETDDRNLETYVMRSRNSRGAIIYGGTEPDVLVLFSFEMQHRGRFSCKVLSVHPPLPDHPHANLSPRLEFPDTIQQYAVVQDLLFDIRANLRNLKDASIGQVPEDEYSDNIEQQLGELHAYYTTGSGSRTSSTHVESEQDVRVWASIAPQTIDRRSTVVLDIAIHDLPDVGWPFYEVFEGIPEPVTERNEEVHVDQDTTYGDYVH